MRKINLLKSFRPAALLLALLLFFGSVGTARSQTLLDPDRLFLVEYSAGEKAGALSAVTDRGGAIRHEFDNIHILAIDIDPAAAADLAGQRGVVDVKTDPLLSLFDQETPYGIDMVQARDTWDADRDGVLDPGAPTGEGIRVCVVDTGIWATHEDLGGGGVTIVAGQSWVNEDPFADGHGHGTHVAGTVAAMNNATGVVGVSPGRVELLIADVFNDLGEGQASSTILAGANWCAEQGADIISMSLGGPQGSLAAGYQALYDQGILVVAAAGNDGAPVNNYPASYPSVISIAAVDSTGTVADFSSFVPEVELAAPGVSVLSAWPYVETVAVSGGPTYGSIPLEFADPAGQITAELANGGDCNLPPTPGAFAGKIALCQRGGLPFKAKIDNAAAGGAVAVIVYNNVAGSFSGTYGACCSPVPAVGMSLADGSDLAANWVGSETTITIHQSGDTGYAELSGTSMATPHASGVAAVLWSACPALTNDQIRSHLGVSTVESGADLLPGRDIFYGYGITQLRDAVDALFDGIDDYDPADPNGDGSNPANVECPELPVVEGGQAAGSGWLAAADGGKINFGFDAEYTDTGPAGSLQLKDRDRSVRIDLTTVTSIHDGGAACADVVSGAAVIEFTGDGTFNGAPASFRVCAADNGTPGIGNDAFFLECTAGCVYRTGDHAADSLIDGGNIRVILPGDAGARDGGGSDASEDGASVLILDPLLAGEVLAGDALTLTVSVYDADLNPLANAAVTLTRVAADGTMTTITALSDLAGVAVFTAVNLAQPVEFIASSGDLQSNAITLEPVLP
ncbi:MAG TPA: S8 family serine peptidase [Anaerolineales bacterium]|nr:S8 family serine peptidase [Anaerolineales bacterium]